MKLAAMYSVFNALELLPGSIKQIYDDVDGIVIAWQNVSNRGNKSPEVEDFMNMLKSSLPDGGKIHLLYFMPDLKIGTKENERRKYQMRLDYAKKLGYTHYFTSATDHYYEPERFRWAKQRCMEEDWCVSLTMMYTYYKYPTWRLTPIEQYCMPFICKLKPETMITASNKYPERVDPSVRITPVDSFYKFTREEIMMHHYSMVRDDIRDKFTNAAA